MDPKQKTFADSKIERRFISSSDLRVARQTRTAFDEGKRQFVGYAARYNALSLPLAGLFREQIAPGTFDETIAKNDIRFLFNHDPNFVLGRNTSRTLRLSSDAAGLKFEVDPPDTQVARDLMEMVDRGDVSQCSFSFQCLEDSWSEDRQGLVRTLKKVTLYDVSAVTYPAYPDTDVALRRFHELDEYHRLRNRRIKLRLAGV